MKKIKNILPKFLILLLLFLNYIIADPPNWDENGDGVLDNFTDYENNGSITAKVYLSDLDIGNINDMIAAFVLDEQRGVGVGEELPPFLGEGYVFMMMIYSNEINGETLSFQYYDSSEDSIFYLEETLEFISNMVIGDAINPYILTYETDSSDDILGCTDSSACNYDPEATANDGSCDYPETNYDCDGNCIADLDCLGICGGDTIFDLCDICDGDNTTCTGCMDLSACNYNPNATIDLGCSYPEENYDCDGNCIIDEDCMGVCGGNAILDECGECNGNGIDEGYCDCQNNLLDCNSLCGGSAFIDNCNECVSGNTGLIECESFTYELNLHYGSNLISFFALPLDNTISNVLIDNNNDYIYSILGESNSSMNLGNNDWQGSISYIEADEGYWFRNINATSIQIYESWNINDNINYSLHEGVNLISFPNSGSYDLEDAIPDDLENKFMAILSESLIAVRLDSGEWIGSLNSFEGGKGYWFMVNDAFDFNYDLSNMSLARNNTYHNSLHTQSSIQTFYFINNINDLDLVIGDWLLAYKDNVIVGSRKWDGISNDIPVMGNDGEFYSSSYCNQGDVIKFKILKDGTTYVDLSGNVPYFSSMEVHFINLYSPNANPEVISINTIYPNPFNPLVSLNYELSKDEYLKISILDINGRVIESLIEGNFVSGSYTVQWDGNEFSSGIYFFQIKSTNSSLMEKITLIK